MIEGIKLKINELSALIAVILIVVMMVIPLPTILLSLLLLVNISLALLILLVAMNNKEPLQLSIFPSLLLLTTLFRLALNVSTTRSILTKGDAGKVVETFGEFVTQGNTIVGFIVFLILVIIQFIVITKGAERVAEVAARFTLDAMPGKQMSIDADLNSGIISEQEARERRKIIEKEADFYGAMDGASKFVKGDAIAGIIILIINIIGGFIIGTTVMGYSLQEAAKHFTNLSIGDGLVSQIPALLISTATGIIVTRAASEGNLSQDITVQLFSYPKLLYIVASVIAFLGILTPIDIVSSMAIAGLLFFGGYKMQQNLNIKSKEIIKQEKHTEKEQIKSPENVLQLINIDPIEFEFGYGLIPLADVKQGGDLLDRIIMIRRQIALELGIIVPVIRVRDNIQLKPNQYIIKIKGNIVGQGEILFNHYLAMSSGLEDDGIIGIKTIEPAFGLPALWIQEEMKERAELAGYTVVDPPSVVATHLTELLKNYAHELLGRKETKQLIDHIKESNPALIEELVPVTLSIGEIQKVLVKLLKERISIRDLTTIFETLADYGKQTKDTDLLTEYVRASLARYITQQFTKQNQVLKVVTIGPEIERKIKEGIQRTESTLHLILDPSDTQKILLKLQEYILKLNQTGQQVIFLTSPSIRMFIRQLVDRISSNIPVLSYNEIEPHVEIETLGVVN